MSTCSPLPPHWQCDVVPLCDNVKTLLLAARRIPDERGCQACHSCLGMKEDGKAELSLNSSILTKMCFNTALQCLESASWLLVEAALFFFLLIQAMREHRFRKLISPYNHEKSIPSTSRGKVRFAVGFPRGAVSVSQPIDCNGSVITPQVSSYPWRALISPAPEQLTTANVFLASITSARKAFIPAYRQEVQICASTRYQTPSKIKRSFFYACKDLGPT